MDEHDHEDGEHCEEIASYFNQSPIYLQAGAQIELNRPEQGLYRISSNAARTAPTNYHVRFSRDDAIPGWDDHEPYDVSRTDFFRELNDYVADGADELVGLSVDEILADPDVLRSFDTVVAADRFMPGGDARSDEERVAYAAAFRTFVENGGNLVLTDGALTALSDVAGLPQDAVSSGAYYAGYIDFHDWDQPTFDRHPLTEEIEKDGTASGRQTLQGTAYHNRRQTYEPVPIGYLVGGPSTCTSGCDAPNWVVDRAAWDDAGGLTLGRTFVRPGPDGGSGWDGVSLGELEVSEGVVRIIGGLLPEPTQDNFHPYGLSAHALTYTGYQVFENATTHENPNRREPVDPDPDPGDADVTLTCLDCAIEVRAGESGDAALEAANTGDAEAEVSFDVTSLPDGWQATVEPRATTLGADGSEELMLTVEVPNNARAGTYEVEVTVSSDGEEHDTATVDVEVVRGRPSDAGPPGGRGAVAAVADGFPAGVTGLALLLGLAVGLATVGARRRRAGG